jgi:hypothetical protein
MSTQRQIFEIEVQASDQEEFSTKRWTFGIDNLNALSMWEMLRALEKLKPAKRTEVLSAAQSVLVASRGWTVPFARIEWAMKIVNGLRLVDPPPGLFEVRAGFSEATEVIDAKVFIAERTKGQGGQKGDFISLAQPSVAINAAGILPRYHMSVTKSNVFSGVPVSKIIDDIAAQGVLKHVIFNSHGRVASGGATTIEVGSGIDSSTNELFKRLAGKVGVIWICGCLAANSESGKADCIARAQNAGAHLVAPAFLMSAGGGDLPAGHIDMNLHFLPHVFTPTGGSIPFAGFLEQKAKLGFTPHFAQ